MEITDYYILPVTNSPNQHFQADVVIDGETRRLGLVLGFREAIGCWTLDISDAAGKALLTGVPLVCGTNVLAPFGGLKLGALVVLDTLNSGAAAAGAGNLGDSMLLLWGSEAV